MSTKKLVMPGKTREAIAKRIKSFKYAFDGLNYVLRTQHNAWIHAFFSIGVLLLGLWLGLSRQDWALLVIAMVMVWLAEFINTALEAVVDLTMPTPHPLAKVAKDVSAAAVLIAAGGSIIIGLLILGPPLYQIIISLFAL